MSRYGRATRKQAGRGSHIRRHTASAKAHNTRGLMLGRFQPFHNGHLVLAKQILNECEELVVAIGSAQFNYIEKDPFTAGERVLMIHRTFSSEKIDLARCYIIPVVNYENNAGWLAHLRSIMPPFDILYSGNEFVGHLALYQDPELKIAAPEFIKREEYNATGIRRLIAEGRPWEHLVPPAVASTIHEIGGVERIKMLSRSDSDPLRW